MNVAVSILANKNLRRVAQVAKYLSNHGMNVCIHVDAKENNEAYSKFCAEIPQSVVTIERQVCEWGAFSLVEAELRMCREIFDRWPDTTHVQLISGDTLPTKSPAELEAFLKTHSDADFIESFAVDDNNWVTGGLGKERFTLRFPFSWKTQRLRFDLWVDLQRRLGIRRALPDELVPYIGSQWWCLTRQTVLAILDDPKKGIYDAYFRKCWIPDEGYFQTLVRKHARKIISKSLVYSKFDHQGKPITFYDDHINDVTGTDAYFVRKVWDGAGDLYKKFLSDGNAINNESSNSASISEQIELATNRRKVGRAGLRMQSREPNRWHEPDITTACSYDVFVGYDNVISNFSDWQASQSSRQILGHVFEDCQIEFPEKDQIGPGGISSNQNIRDVSPGCFLANIIWQYRVNGLTFLLNVDSDTKYQKMLASDRNAKIHHIKYSWLFDLMRQNIENEQLLRRRASELMSAEVEFINIAQSTKANCHFFTRSLADCYSNSHTVFSDLTEQMTGKKTEGPLLLPQMRDAATIGTFARHLKDIGVDLDMDKVLGLAQARPNTQAEIQH